MLFNSAWDSFWLNRLKGRMTCLLYHRVDDPDHVPFLKVPVISPEAFEKELSFLTGKGAVFFTCEQMLKGLFPAPDKVGFIVTFDDCFLDNYTAGLGVLDKLGIKGTFFQSTDMVEGKSLIWEHALYWFVRDEISAQKFTDAAHEALAQYPGALRLSGLQLVKYLIDGQEVPFEKIKGLVDSHSHLLNCSEELAEIADKLYPKAGHLRQAHEHGHEIASHGHSHCRRTMIDSVLFEKELALSSEKIERITGRKPTAFSYPFNSYFEEDQMVCAKCFSQVFTVDQAHIEPGADRLSLPRFTWPGNMNNPFRRRRWLLTGTV